RVATNRLILVTRVCPRRNEVWVTTSKRKVFYALDYLCDSTGSLAAWFCRVPCSRRLHPYSPSNCRGGSHSPIDWRSQAAVVSAACNLQESLASFSSLSESLVLLGVAFTGRPRRRTRSLVHWRSSTRKIRESIFRRS